MLCIIIVYISSITLPMNIISQSKHNISLGVTVAVFPLLICEGTFKGFSKQTSVSGES